MEHSLTGLALKIQEADRAQDAANAMMKRVFTIGKGVYFRRGNMTRNALGKVIWARMIQGSAELRITNLDTGKDRTISFDDVVQI